MTLPANWKADLKWPTLFSGTSLEKLQKSRSFWPNQPLSGKLIEQRGHNLSCLMCSLCKKKLLLPVIRQHRLKPLHRSTQLSESTERLHSKSNTQTTVSHFWILQVLKKVSKLQSHGPLLSKMLLRGSATSISPHLWESWQKLPCRCRSLLPKSLGHLETATLETLEAGSSDWITWRAHFGVINHCDVKPTAPNTFLKESKLQLAS